MKIQISVLLLILLAGCFVSCRTEVKEKEDSVVQVSPDDLSSLNKSIAENPDDASLYYKRAQIFLKKNNVRQSYDDISNAVKLDSTRSEYYLFLADVSFRGLQIPQSVTSFKKAIQLDPKNKEARLKLAELYLYLKAYPNSISEANEALKIDKQSGRAYFIKGFSYKESGDTSKAISSFQTAIEVQPDYYDAYIQLGNIFAARKNPLALQYYNSALRLQPESLEAFYNRGLWYQQSGDLEKASDDYNTILKKDPRYSEAHYNLGYIDLAFNNDYDAAIKHFTDAIRSNDQYAEAYYNRGVCYEMKGEKAAAEKDFREALNIFPTFKLAKDKLK